MKHWIFISAATLFCAAGCGLCDTDSDNVNENARYASTYKLSAWNAPVAVDINQDGTSSRNLTTESDCFQP